MKIAILSQAKLWNMRLERTVHLLPGHFTASRSILNIPAGTLGCFEPLYSMDGRESRKRLKVKSWNSATFFRVCFEDEITRICCENMTQVWDCASKSMRYQKMPFHPSEHWRLHEVRALSCGYLESECCEDKTSRTAVISANGWPERGLTNSK